MTSQELLPTEKLDERGKAHRYEDKSGVIHACEQSGHSGHPNLVWTRCGIDVPANKSFKSFDALTCKQCVEHFTIPSVVTEPAVEGEVVELVKAFEDAIRVHCRSYGSSYSVIDGYEAIVKQSRDKLIAALPSAAVKVDDDNYVGCMADLQAIVAAYRKRMPNDEWLNLNYPVKSSATPPITKLDEREAITIADLIKILEKMPKSYSVHANFKQELVAGITGAIDIGGDYFSQVFLENFDHDPEWHVGQEATYLSRPQPLRQLVDEREAFEVWATINKGWNLKRNDDDTYTYHEQAWLAWQARASLTPAKSDGEVL